MPAPVVGMVVFAGAVLSLGAGIGLARWLGLLEHDTMPASRSVDGRDV